MIKNLESLVTITSSNVVTCVVDHIINVNKKIQNRVWEGGLLTDAKKYMSHPQPPPRRMKGTRDYTGTLYLLFQTLVGLSLITESKYCIQRDKIKLPP